MRSKLYERAYWNRNSYGSALKIDKSWIRAALVLLCIITPGTNWAIPFLGKLVKTDYVYRF